MVQLGSVTVCLRFYLTPLLILDDIELEQPVLPEDPDSRPKDFPPLPYKRKPVKQKRRNFSPERQRAIDEEVEKLLKAGIICEVKCPEWLASVVMVRKANGKW
ncbi:hypothetical protein AgCh_014479 [Apium graveolens]